VDDEPGQDSCRGLIERNAIGLLSNYCKFPVDSPSPKWLGHFSNHPLVVGSGLWNQQHVDKPHAPEFLHEFERRLEWLNTSR
jgi:hypothetical protein